MDTCRHVGISTERYPPSWQELSSTSPYLHEAARYLYGRPYKYIPPTAKLKSSSITYKKPRRLYSLLRHKIAKTKPSIKLQYFNNSNNIDINNMGGKKKKKSPTKRQNNANNKPNKKVTVQEKQIPVEDASLSQDDIDTSSSHKKKEADVVPPSNNKSPSKKSKAPDGSSNNYYSPLNSTPPRTSGKAKAGSKRGKTSTPTRHSPNNSSSPSPRKELFNEEGDTEEVNLVDKLPNKFPPPPVDKKVLENLLTDKILQKKYSINKLTTDDFFRDYSSSSSSSEELSVTASADSDNFSDEDDKETAREKYDKQLEKHRAVRKKLRRERRNKAVQERATEARALKEAFSREMRRKEQAMEPADDSSSDSEDENSEGSSDESMDNLQRNSNIDTSKDPEIDDKLKEKMNKIKKKKKKEDEGKKVNNQAPGLYSPPRAKPSSQTPPSAPPRNSEKTPKASDDGHVPERDKNKPRKKALSLFEKLKISNNAPKIKKKSSSYKPSNAEMRAGAAEDQFEEIDEDFGSPAFIQKLPSRQPGCNVSVLSLRIEPPSRDSQVKKNLRKVLGRLLEGGSSADRRFGVHCISQGKIGDITELLRSLDDDMAPETDEALFDWFKFQNWYMTRRDLGYDRNGKKLKRKALNIVMVIDHKVDLSQVIMRMQAAIDDMNASVYYKNHQEMETRSDHGIANISNKLNRAGVAQMIQMALDRAKTEMFQKNMISAEEEESDLPSPVVNARMNLESAIVTDPNKKYVNLVKAYDLFQSSKSDYKKLWQVEYPERDINDDRLTGNKTLLNKVWIYASENEFFRELLGPGATVLGVGNLKTPRDPGERKKHTVTMGYHITMNMATKIITVSEFINPHYCSNISMQKYEGSDMEFGIIPRNTELLVRRLGTEDNKRNWLKAQFVEETPDGQALVVLHSGDRITIPRDHVKLARPYKSASIAKIFTKMLVYDDNGVKVPGFFATSVIPLINSYQGDGTQMAIKKDDFRNNVVDNAEASWVAWLFYYCIHKLRFNRSSTERLLKYTVTPDDFLLLNTAVYDPETGKVTTPFFSTEDRTEQIMEEQGIIIADLQASLRNADARAAEAADDAQDVAVADRMREQMGLREGGTGDSVGSQASMRTDASQATAATVSSFKVKQINSDFRKTKLQAAKQAGTIADLEKKGKDKDAEIAKLKAQLTKQSNRRSRHSRGSGDSSQVSGISSKETMSMDSVREEDDDEDMSYEEANQKRKAGVQFGENEEYEIQDPPSFQGDNGSVASSELDSDAEQDEDEMEDDDGEQLDGLELLVTQVGQAIGRVGRGMKVGTIDRSPELVKAMEVVIHRMASIVPLEFRQDNFYGTSDEEDCFDCDEEAIDLIMEGATQDNAIIGWDVTPKVIAKELLMPLEDKKLGYGALCTIKKALRTSRASFSVMLWLKLNILVSLLGGKCPSTEEEEDVGAEEYPYDLDIAMQWLINTTEMSTDSSTTPQDE